MQKRISNFLTKQYLCTIATVENDQTLSFSSYYAFDAENLRLIYIAVDQSKQAHLMAKNPKVSGTIFTPTKYHSLLQRVQFLGFSRKLDDVSAEEAKTLYCSKYNHPMMDKFSIWEIKLSFVRLIDNSLGVFSKMEWKFGDCSVKDDFKTISKEIA